MTAIIELERLAKKYGPITALDDVTAVVGGSIIGLLGPNGAGKSTLLKCLLGLLPYQGRARVLGLDAAAQGAEIRDRVGYMPEQEAFLSGMSAVELCTYAGELSGLPRTEAMQRAHAALYYAGLEEKRYLPIDGYSTGMKQRVKLAQALVHDPEILFLDEPTNGLDPRSREEMLDLIVELPVRRGCTIILSTHLLPDVDRVCDHAVIMHCGAVRFVGTIDELRGTRGEVAPLMPQTEAMHPPSSELATGRNSRFFVEVKADAARLGEALTAAGATCKVTSAAALQVDLPANATTQLVFATAQAAGVQIRALGKWRESLEAAFLRVISDPAAAPGAGIYRSAP